MRRDEVALEIDATLDGIGTKAHQFSGNAPVRMTEINRMKDALIIDIDGTVEDETGGWSEVDLHIDLDFNYSGPGPVLTYTGWIDDVAVEGSLSYE
jgi:hypothetical protein